MRLFYRCFPKCDTLRHELTWSHYRRLISVENEAARLWYMNEAAFTCQLKKNLNGCWNP